ncbi:hypothetical protein EDB83DRAFT_2379244 [Lactarius deliciosus]|nr:hypothetical protein EDB83DRAFT_2379244 [Lactarius deliciosus]
MLGMKLEFGVLVLFSFGFCALLHLHPFSQAVSDNTSSDQLQSTQAWAACFISPLVENISCFVWYSRAL